MPVILRKNGWRFYFFSYEGSPREPVHVHVAKPGVDAKVWLYPEPRVAYNHGVNARDMRLILEIVSEHSREIEEAWHDFFAKTDKS